MKLSPRLTRWSIVLLAIIGALVALYFAVSQAYSARPSREPTWGVSFSQYYAMEELGLDWREAYRAILDELRPDRVRLVAYWRYLEPARGTFDFSDLDYEIAEAERRQVKVILAVGQRVPRWPECHWPAWARDLDREPFRGAVNKFIETVVRRYLDSPAVVMWQVENEPLFNLFGECPPASRTFLKEQVTLVKAIDRYRPVMVTDTGEFSLWWRSGGISEVLGTTLYRVAWSQYLGWGKHFLPSFFYSLRADLVRALSGTKKVIIAELQVEPWAPNRKRLVDFSLEDQISHFDLAQLKENVNFARATRLPEAYLWGVEWWYWRKLHNDPTFWDFGRQLFVRAGR